MPRPLNPRWLARQVERLHRATLQTDTATAHRVVSEVARHLAACGHGKEAERLAKCLPK